MADTKSRFDHVDYVDASIAFTLSGMAKQDKSPNKVELLLGAYRTGEGKPYVFPVVRKVEQAMAADMEANHEYLPIEGLQSFSTAATKFALGADSPAIKENRVADIQTISGTGALRLALEFIKNCYGVRPIYVSDPIYSNHKKVIIASGFSDMRDHHYFDSKTGGLDFPAMVEDLKGAPDGSLILFHGCAHNPCGVDLNQDQWKIVVEILQKNNMLPIIDLAYPGFASGDVETDLWPVRYIVNLGMELIVTQSFSKIFGLYNERCGNLAIICKNDKPIYNIKSQLKAIVRPMYSNPPNHGAQIIARILNDEELAKEWRGELKQMCERVLDMRRLLRQKLTENGTPGDWCRMTNQRGFFTYSGLTKDQVNWLREEKHIYMLPSGRINMCGINYGNVDYIADSIKEAVQKFS